MAPVRIGEGGEKLGIRLNLSYCSVAAHPGWVDTLYGHASTAERPEEVIERHVGIGVTYHIRPLWV